MKQGESAHHDAVELAVSVPPLMLEARELAASFMNGQHGRRRYGWGDEFWQFKPFVNGVDRLADIDWRRSAKSDQTFVRQTEWRVPQALSLWVDPSETMRLSGPPTKSHRAMVLALALGICAEQAGEKISEIGQPVQSGFGSQHLQRIHDAFLKQTPSEYADTMNVVFERKSKALLFSDFLGDLSVVEHFLALAKASSVRGVLVQILTPQEMTFRFDGAALFSSALGQITFHTNQAAALRQDYLTRLADRRRRLERLAAAAGWDIYLHQLDHPPLEAMLAMYRCLSRRGNA